MVRAFLLVAALVVRVNLASEVIVVHKIQVWLNVFVKYDVPRSANVSRLCGS